MDRSEMAQNIASIHRRYILNEYHISLYHIPIASLKEKVNFKKAHSKQPPTHSRC